MSGAAITLAGVAHCYGDVEALAPTDVDIEPGRFVALVGPSGCGKSTLLRILAGLVAPVAGVARIGDEIANGRPGLAAYQPQHDALMPWRRVLANAALGAEVAGIARADARARAEQLLDQFGLGEFAHEWPSTLSGGMRQRVALLRTFLVPRPVLLLDEPLGALDAITRRHLQEWLEGVWLVDGRTVVLVSHDVDEALRLADRVVVLSPRPGRVVLDLAVPLGRPRDVTDAAVVERKRELLRALGA